MADGSSRSRVQVWQEKRPFLGFQGEEREQMLVAFLFSPVSRGSALKVEVASVGSLRDEQGDGVLVSTLDSPMKGCFIVVVGHVGKKALAKQKREEASVLTQSSKMKRSSPVCGVTMDERDESNHLLLTERAFNDKAYQGSPRGHPRCGIE